MGQMGAGVLHVGRCTVRTWQPGDEPGLVEHANNRKIWRNLRDAFPHPYTLGDARRWIESVQGETPPVSFAVVVEGGVAGGIGLRLGVDVHRRSAEIGYWLGEQFWGRGLATEAVRAVTRYAFSRLDLCRVHAGVFGWNPASARVLEKAGYQLEGRIRQSVTKDGHTLDELLYAAIRPDS